MTKKSQKMKSDNPVLASNRSASHEFYLERFLEAGIVLTGPEVKSAREGKVNLKESYGRIKDGEVFLIGAHFSPYVHSRMEETDPLRKRKLLLHATEIRKLEKDVDQGGFTIVPTKLYLKGGKIKIEIAVAKGKKQRDKRETSRDRDVQREMDRVRRERG